MIRSRKNFFHCFKGHLPFFFNPQLWTFLLRRQNKPKFSSQLDQNSTTAAPPLRSVPELNPTERPTFAENFRKRLDCDKVVLPFISNREIASIKSEFQLLRSRLCELRLLCYTTPEAAYLHSKHATRDVFASFFPFFLLRAPRGIEKLPANGKSAAGGKLALSFALSIEHIRARGPWQSSHER